MHSQNFCLHTATVSLDVYINNFHLLEICEIELSFM